MTTDVEKHGHLKSKAKYPAYVWADQLGKGIIAIHLILIQRRLFIVTASISIYSLPRGLINKAFRKLDLSITGQNLGYITAAKTVAA